METGIWDYEFLSKREIYSKLREVGGQYGACMAVDKGSAVHRCMDALMALPSSNVNMVVHCRECKHAYINSFSASAGQALCRRLTNMADGIQFVMDSDDFCSYGEKKD